MILVSIHRECTGFPPVIHSVAGKPHCIRLERMNEIALRGSHFWNQLQTESELCWRQVDGQLERRRPNGVAANHPVDVPIDDALTGAVIKF